jgi:agmatinase
MEHVESLTQVGIRSLRHSPAMIEDSINDGNRVVTMSEFHEMEPRGLADVVPQGAAVYVSIDVDVLDLSLVPGYVSAEPNGMTYAELRDTLEAIAEHARVVGFDFVGVNPQLDVGTLRTGRNEPVRQSAGTSARGAQRLHDRGVRCAVRGARNQPRKSRDRNRW